MNLNLRKLATAAVVSIALIGGIFTATAPAQASHKYGHAFAGGILTGLLGAAIFNNNRRQPIYQQPAYPAYGQRVRTCYWQDIVEYDRWSQPVYSRIRICR